MRLIVVLEYLVEASNIQIASQQPKKERFNSSEMIGNE
jgi:hypothetical protein